MGIAVLDWPGFTIPFVPLQQTVKAAAKARLRSVVQNAMRGVDPAKDIDYELQRRALASTADFVISNLQQVPAYRGDDWVAGRSALLAASLMRAPNDGLVLEFGVASGYTLREIAAVRPVCYGFDVFTGLPEFWRTGYDQGAFAGDLPDVGTAQLVVGLFQDTLPTFLAEHPEPFAFVHMDGDLYSSAKTVFDVGFDRFVPGTVIHFDEYFNYPGWEEGEHKAWLEFLDKYSGGFEYIGYNSMHEQVSVVLT